MFLISAPFLQDFNPRSREGSDRVAISSFVYLLYFNPRSREGSDDVLVAGFHNCRISIHAPAKGATMCSHRGKCARTFQSTLPRRERHFFIFCQLSNVRYFNPRSREGSDSPSPSAMVSSSPFQSTLPRRERLHIICISPCHTYFNPRSREGSDRLWYVYTDPIQDFNPRSREGSDHFGNAYVWIQAISIHAPAKGATLE